MMAGTLINRYNAESSISSAKSFWKELWKGIINGIKLNIFPALEILLWGTYSKEVSKGKVKSWYKDVCDYSMYEEKRATENERVRCHHWLDGHEFEQTPGDCEGQRSLACCNPWGLKESNTTEELNGDNIWGKTKPPKWAKQRKNYHSHIKTVSVGRT